MGSKISVDIKAQGARLSEFFKKNKLKQVEIANKYSITPGAISRYVAGDLKIPYELLVKISTDFRLNIDWIYTGKGNKTIQQENENLLTNIKELKDQILILTATVQQYQRITDRLVRDFYSAKHGA